MEGNNEKLKNHSSKMDQTKTSTSSDKYNGESMSDELSQVLKLYREKKNNLDIHKTPEIFIQPSSSPCEVKKWLKAKGFSDQVVKKLGYLNGYELFSLSRETLEEHCGLDEGRRLLSQITIQKNVSGVSYVQTNIKQISSLNFNAFILNSLNAKKIIYQFNSNQLLTNEIN